MVEDAVARSPFVILSMEEKILEPENVLLSVRSVEEAELPVGRQVPFTA